MKLSEALKLALLFETVDGGCPHCIANVCRQANKIHLGWYWWFASGSRKVVEVHKTKENLPSEALE